MSEVERVASALRQPTRRAILLALLDDPRPRSVDEVAELAGVHRTVAFQHLERLAGLGYLRSEPRRGLRGKPAKLYRAAAEGLELSHPRRRFAELAGLLAGALEACGEDGLRAAHAAGRSYGAALAAALPSLGADYVFEESVISARNCVFREACECGRRVVCGLHAGLLEGALASGGLEARVTPRGPDGGRGCTFELRRV